MLIGMLAKRPPGLKDDEVSVSPLKESMIAATKRLGAFCDSVNKPDIILFCENRYGTGSMERVNNVLLLEGAGLGRYLGKLS